MLAIPPVRVSSAVPLLEFVRVVAVAFIVSWPLIVRAEVVLLSVIAVTLEPTAALISVEPAPVPELVIVPMLLTAAVEIVMPFPVELLLLSTRLPVVLATPPVRVSSAVPLEFVRVVAVALVVSWPLIVRAEVVLLWVMPVTLDPIAALISVAPVPVPELKQRN